MTLSRSSVETVCFDLDDTLIEYRQDSDERLNTAFRRAGVGRFCSSDELWALASETPDADDDHQFLTDLFRAAAKRHGGPTESAETLARTYEAATDHTDVRFRPGAEAALDAARELGPVGLITNGGPEIQRQKLRALDLGSAFDTTVYAGAETAGAGGAGLQTAWYPREGDRDKRADTHAPDHTFDSLSDLARLLE